MASRPAPAWRGMEEAIFSKGWPVKVGSNATKTSNISGGSKERGLFLAGETPPNGPPTDFVNLGFQIR